MAETPVSVPVNSVPNKGGGVALTMDLCSCPACTRRFEQQYYNAIKEVDAYAKKKGQDGAHITVFASAAYYEQDVSIKGKDGKKVVDTKSGRDVIEQLILDGQEIGAHGSSHLPRGMIKPGDKETLNKEFDDPQAEYAKTLEDMASKGLLTKKDSGYVNAKTGAAVPSALKVDRAPWGSSTTESMQAAAAHGLTTINWNKDGDGAHNNSGMFVKAMDGVKAGDIILTHGNGNGHHEGANDADDTVASLEAAIDKGLHFSTVSDLIKSGTPQLAQHPLAREDIVQHSGGSPEKGSLTEDELGMMAGQYAKAARDRRLPEELIKTYLEQRNKTADDLKGKQAAVTPRVEAASETQAPAPAPALAADTRRTGKILGDDKSEVGNWSWEPADGATLPGIHAPGTFKADMNNQIQFKIDYDGQGGRVFQKKEKNGDWENIEDVHKLPTDQQDFILHAAFDEMKTAPHAEDAKRLDANGPDAKRVDDVSARSVVAKAETAVVPDTAAPAAKPQHVTHKRKHHHYRHHLDHGHHHHGHGHKHGHHLHPNGPPRHDLRTAIKHEAVTSAGEFRAETQETNTDGHTLRGRLFGPTAY